MRLRRLRTQLAATFLLVAALPTALAGGAALWLAVQRAEAEVALRNQQVAEAVAGEVGRFLEAQVVHLRELALVVESAPAELAGDAERHQRANKVLRTVLVLDPGGRVDGAVPPDPDLLGIDMSGQPAVREALSRREPTWSQATTSIQTGLPVVTLVVPGRRRAVLGYLDLSVLRDIAGRGREGARGRAAVLDRDGTFIAGTDDRQVREHVNVRDLPLVKAGLGGAGATGQYRLDGQLWLGSVARVPISGWLVLVTEPAEEALAPVARLRAALLLVLAAAAAAALLAGWWSHRRLLRPLEALGEATRRIAAGERPAGAAAAPLAFTEYQDLAERFDAMAEAVRAREAELARSEASLRRMVESPLVGIARTRADDGRILFCNETLARMLGFDGAAELAGRSIASLYRDPALRHRTVTALGERGQVVNQEVEMLTRDGQPRTMLLNLSRDGDTLVGIVVDVSEQRRADRDRARLEQELQHSQRLEAVGRLAGGVAHDFNNLLTAIIGDGTLLLEELEGHPARHHVQGIMEAAARAAQLTRSLLAFSRKQPLRPRPVDLREVVRGVERLVRRVVGEDVALRLELPPGPVTVVADAAQLEQVLVNLCTNARDAMPRGGRITLTAAPAAPGPEEAAALGLEGPGPWARLAVADTGEGIRPEELPRVFEPFFTTKGVGRGTGLGLSIVDGIVKQHGGHIGVASRVGQGTTFTIHLPAAEPGAVAATSAGPASAPGPGGRETILLAEDEPAVRRVLQATLERAGYTVLAAEDGAQALARFRVAPAAVDLCLLDVIMPVMNGREACDAIRLVDPTARVLFVSGYTADLLERRGVAEGLPPVVMKPVAPAELLARVRAELDRPRPGWVGERSVK